MKKVLFPIVFVIAIAIAAAPFIVGLRVKSDANDFIAGVNQELPYKAEWVFFKSGWLQSKGQLKVGMDSSAFADIPEFAEAIEKLSLKLDVSIDHGPFLKNTGLKDAGLGWANWKISLPDSAQLRKYIDWDANSPLYEISGVIGLGGDVVYRDAIAAVKSKAGSEVAFAFGGYLGNADISDGQMSYSGKSGNLEVSSALASVSIDPMLIDMSAEAGLEALLSYDLYESAASIVVPNVSIEGIQSFQLENLEIKSAIEMPSSEDLANISVSYLIGSIETEPLAIKDVALEMALENYSSEFHDLYMQFAKDLSQSGAAEPDPQMMQDFAQNALPTLLNFGPKFKLDKLAFSLPSGDFSGSAEIKLDPVSSMPANPADISFWMDKVSAEASISADQALVKYIGDIALRQQVIEAAKEEIDQQAVDQEQGAQEPDQSPQMSEEQIAEIVDMQMQQGIGMLEGMGIIVVSDDKYSLDFKYDRGQTLVNGQEFAVPLGALMGTP